MRTRLQGRWFTAMESKGFVTLRCIPTPPFAIVVVQQPVPQLQRAGRAENGEEGSSDGHWSGAERERKSTREVCR